MSFPCVSLARECDGCMACRQPGEVIACCAQCGEPIYEGEDFYEFPDGGAVHEDCGLDYIERFLKRG